MADFDCVLRTADPSNGFVLQSEVTAPVVFGAAVTIATGIRVDRVGSAVGAVDAFDVTFKPRAGVVLTSATFVSYNAAIGELTYNLAGSGAGNLTVELTYWHTGAR